MSGCKLGLLLLLGLLLWLDPVHGDPRRPVREAPDFVIGQRLGREAPELDGGIAWLNTAGPLRMRDLRGKTFARWSQTTSHAAAARR